ncbi:unnamed protein product [Clavelina lepadiformis]|uniref:Uncharacterized protein n=1 Tax=Clavelina lepadiformis TaxID=159417 RepID=A0ABP0G4L7_CLALP
MQPQSQIINSAGQSSSVSDGDDEDDDDDDATTSSATFRTSWTGCKILPPKRFSDYKHNMFVCLLLTCFFLFTSAAQVNLHLDSRQFHPSLGSLASCSIERGYCLTGNRMFIWRVPLHINCPPTKPLGSHKMLLHYNSTSLYRVSLPDLGISVHHWRKCSTRAKSCYGNHIHCDDNNFIFRYHQCTELDRIALFRPNLPRRVSSQTPHSQFSRLLATFDTQQDDLISEVLTTFNEENKFLHC